MTDIGRKYAESGARYLFEKKPFVTAFPNELATPESIAAQTWLRIFGSYSVKISENAEPIELASYYSPIMSRPPEGDDPDGWLLWSVLSDGWAKISHSKWKTYFHHDAPELERIGLIGDIWEKALFSDRIDFPTPKSPAFESSLLCQSALRDAMSCLGSEIAVWMSLETTFRQQP